MMFFCHSDLILTTNERNEWDEYDHFSYREGGGGVGGGMKNRSTVEWREGVKKK